jgi:NAD(P)-dependent dehydrogenase (short-subunit alcohol dehydrogenase family)
MQNEADLRPVVVITGLARGIGRAMALAFEAEGYRVLGIDKLHNPYYVGDLAEKDDLDSFVAYIKRETPQIKCLINNACFSAGGMMECDYEAFQAVLAVGLTAPYYLTQQLAVQMASGASVINIASTRAFQSQAQTESYSAAKGGLIALTHAMAMSLTGIARVNAISPGWIDNEGVDYRDANALQHPVQRVGMPEDIAKLALFLASDSASFINGENIMVDGGMSKKMVYHEDEGWRYTPS